MPGFEPKDPDYAAKVGRVMAAQGFTKSIGTELLDVGPGTVEIALTPTANLFQFTGALHGGVVSALADHAAGGAATSLYPADQIAVTIELKINFLEPATGDRIVARAQVERVGRNICVVTSRVYAVSDGVEGQCALATVTLTPVNAVV